VIDRGGRRGQAFTAAMLFSVSASAAGAFVFGICGVIGGIWPLGVTGAYLAALAYAGAAAWYATGRRVVPFGRVAVQTSRTASYRGRGGIAYIGIVLGAGLLTEMSTPLVWCGALAAVAMGLPWAAAFGGVFAIGRSIPLLVAASRPRPLSPAIVLDFMIRRLPGVFRWPGFLTAAAGSVVTLRLLL